MNTIYRELNNKIQTILESVDKVSSIYAYPAKKIDSYPSAIYYPSTFENTFETTGSNFKTYGYRLWIVVNTEGTTIENVFDTIMPNVMDEVLQAIDEGWDFSTIGGHRVWCKVDTGGWSVSEENAGVEVTAEIDLSIKLLTNN
jgi:hypothetical protein